MKERRIERERLAESTADYLTTYTYINPDE